MSELTLDLTFLCPETGRPCLDQRWVSDDNVVTEAQSSWISADSASKSPLIASGRFLYLVNWIFPVLSETSCRDFANMLSGKRGKQ